MADEESQPDMNAGEEVQPPAAEEAPPPPEEAPSPPPPPPPEEAPPPPEEPPPAAVEAPPPPEEAPQPPEEAPPPPEDAPPAAEEVPLPLEPDQGDLPPSEALPEADAPPALVKPPIEPLGVATSKTLLELDMKPFILEKPFNEGKMARFTKADSGGGKVKEGGSAQYENHQWQLEHMFREIPKEMRAGIGLVRSKPDSLIYEEEKFILGKMERDLRENEGGYAPIAGKRESELEVNPNVTVPSNLPREPEPCPLPSIDEDEGRCGGGEMSASQPPRPTPSPSSTRNCFTKVKSPKGKVFEFAYSGVTACSVASKALAVQQSSCKKQADTPSTQCLKPAPSGVNEPQVVEKYRCPPVESRPSPPNVNLAKSQCQAQAEAPGPSEEGGCQAKKQSAEGGCQAKKQSEDGGCQAKKQSGGGGPQCVGNPSVESHIEAVCNAARNAMAIYDTLTGIDNFPCNVGDRPELSEGNTEDGVWSWLYQLIFKLVPIDTDSNCNNVPR